MFWMRFSLTLEIGVICPPRVPFFVLPCIWVAPICVVNVVTRVLVYVGLMPHILEWSYQLFIFGNTTSV